MRFNWLILEKWVTRVALVCIFGILLWFDGPIFTLSNKILPDCPEATFAVSMTTPEGMATVVDTAHYVRIQELLATGGCK